MGPSFIRPFRILDRISMMVYLLDLLEELCHIHSTFHALQLKKCITDVKNIVPLDNIQINKSLNYVERPVLVLERKKKALYNKVIGQVKM